MNDVNDVTADDASRDTSALFEEFARTRKRKDRNRLVEAHLGFAHHVAARYANRGVPAEDLRQIALLALVKAVDRFDPSREIAFTSFAGPTIEGEIKRFFRDATWSVRVPRSVKERHLLVRKASEELGQRLHRSPSVKELAAHLDVTTDEVVEALGASAAYSTRSIDAPVGGDDDGGGQDRVGDLAQVDEQLQASENRLLIERLIERLPEREREIVRLRFFEHLTQSEIADRMGISQMHVSRLLRKSFDLMRAAATD